MTLAPGGRIGVDLGGTKIAAVALTPDGVFGPQVRRPTPAGDYAAGLDAIREICGAAIAAAGGDPSAQWRVGVAMPGSIAPRTGAVQNANSTWLNNRPFLHDLEAALGRPARAANDANCFALSEATDGAAADARSVFGVILGTGCGGGIVIDRTLVDGPRGIAGEWGHTPLPHPTADEQPGPQCWCGRAGCLETWISGTGLAADYQRVTGNTVAGGEEVAQRADAGEPEAQAAMDRHAERLARGLGVIVTILDPDVIVLGGGLSRRTELYRTLPDLIAPHVFAADTVVAVKAPRWGDASGVRGAAWLWPDGTPAG